MDNSYISNINVNIPINEQVLKNDTRSLLSLIYRNYWCNEEKKKEFLTEDAYLKSERERKIREKYNPDNIFKNKQQNIINEDSLENGTSIVEYKESTIFSMIINKIKYIFRACRYLDIDELYTNVESPPSYKWDSRERQKDLEEIKALISNE